MTRYKSLTELTAERNASSNNENYGGGQQIVNEKNCFYHKCLMRSKLCMIIVAYFFGATTLGTITLEVKFLNYIKVKYPKKIFEESMC